MAESKPLRGSPTPEPPSRFPVQRIPPSHDYIRRHGSGPKDGWAKGPADPGPPPQAQGATQDQPDAPPFGEIHKFGYTRPLKKHEQALPGELQGEPVDDFVHLHVHSNFSFLDGGSRIEELVARAAELGQPALALTDHEGLYGAVRFAKACAKRGIKPIFGAEIRVESLLAPPATGIPASPVTGAPDPPADPHHLVLLAETREGYANLCRLLSAAHLADPKRERPPLVTLESLHSHAEGLICLTGCRHGEVGYLLDSNRDGDAHAALLHLRDIFGPAHLYVELQYFGYEPHEEARAGQHGASVYEKVRGDDNRLRHRPTTQPAPATRAVSTEPPSSRPDPPRADTSSTGSGSGSCPMHISCIAISVASIGPAVQATSASPAVSTHPASRRLQPSAEDRYPADSLDTSSQTSYMRHRCNATIVASWRTADRPAAGACPQPSARRPPAALRPDLPQGQPQRLNPADYDIGFHRDGRPWRLSCLTYCERLVRLATACALPTVLTTDAHYAGENDRALHLICRAAGRDKPLSGYPEPVPGARCLKSKAELEALTAPLLELIEPPGEPDESWEDCLDPEAAMHLYCSAVKVAEWEDSDERGGAAPTSPGGVSGAAPSAGGSAGTSAAGPLAAAAAIAARCTVDLDLGTYHFPQVAIPKGETAYSLLAKRCFRGIARQYKPVPPRAVELLEKELRMIQQMGFAHYFLVVHDIVRWARAKGVACSGRGSAGNSIVCHALDITASEPIRHNLLFERFLNPNRREMPDIDVDFCSSRRDEVIDHIYKTFGDQNVAVVANVNTMSPRSAVRIVAEALGFAPTEINALAQHVPHHGDAARIREYLAGAWPELRDSPLQDSAPPTPGPDGTLQGGGRYWRFLDLVERLDAYPMHLGTHLGGFVITDRPITYYAPLQWAAKGVVVIQFNKDDVAALGLVKMDILGLRTHSAVSETVHLIRQRTGRRIRPYELPPDDPAAYEIISNGGSIGLFQLESAGQRNLASRLQEQDFDDVIAAIALYRPGPLEAEMIGPFIDRRWGIEPVSLPHPAMAEAVADTYGVILYQEQVLRIAQSVAGFDLADADSLRRAMTRDRSREEMAKIGETFIARAVERGVPEEAAREVFRQLEGFAAYGFNKSHSVCFAVISYATAWLKAYYPAEFLCSVLNNYPMGFYTPRTVLNDARRFGLEVRPLDINLSGRGFTVEDEVPPDPWGGLPASGAQPGLLGSGAKAPYDPFAQAWTAEHDWGLTDADLAELEQEQNGEAAYAEALRVALEQAHAAEKHRDSENPGGAPQGANPGAVLTGGAGAPAVSLAAGGEPCPDGGAAPPLGEWTPGAQSPLVARDKPLHRPLNSDVSPSERDGQAQDKDAKSVNSSAIGATEDDVLCRPVRSDGRDFVFQRPLNPGDLLLPRAPRARGGVKPGACLAPSSGIAPDAGRALRVGFSYLKQMGDRSLDRLEEERRHGPFSSFEDFYLRTRIDYPVAENLIRVGAFDSIEPDRTELLWRLPLLHDRLEALAGSSGGRRGQLRAFFSPPSRAGLERSWSREDKVRSELELLGLTVTCHPLELYEEALRRMGVRMSYELPGMGDEVPVMVAGVYERAQNPWMRSGKRTMFLTLEDAYGLYECVCFESKLAKIAPVVARASYFLVRGRLQNNHKRGLAIVAEEVFDLEEVLARKRARQQRFTTAAPSPALLAIPDATDMIERQQVEVHGNGQRSSKVRAPGAAGGAIPKKVG